MAKKKETTAKSVIKDLLAKAWDKVKGKPRSERGTKAEVQAREVKRIAEKAGRSAKQIRDIEKGKRPGKNLLEPLKRLKAGRKVAAPPKEPKKITRKAKPAKPAKPAKKPPEKPPAPPAPPALPPMPNGLKVKITGEIAPFKNDDYLRTRTITQVLKGDALRDFLKLWTSGNEVKALKYATAIYFGAVPKD